MNAIQVFLFGKAPAFGDFVCRGLSAAERGRWDLWCSAVLAEARERLGDGFDDAHLRTQPWRFVLRPEAADWPWMAGCVTPSCDRVGRPFLLALGVKSAVPLDPATLGARLAERMRTHIRDAFHADMDIDRLLSAAQSTATQAAAAAPDDPVQSPLPVEMTCWRTWRIGVPATAATSGECP